MIEIKPLTENELSARVELLNNPEISKFLNTHEIFNIEKTINWFKEIKKDKSRFDCVFYVNTQIIGMGGLVKINYINKNAELYMYLNPVFQGMGFGFKSAKKLCEYGFNKFNLEKIYLFTFNENYRANRLYEKLGFKLEGILRQHTIKDGVLKDRNV